MWIPMLMMPGRMMNGLFTAPDDMRRRVYILNHHARLSDEVEADHLNSEKRDAKMVLIRLTYAGRR